RADLGEDAALGGGDLENPKGALVVRHVRADDHLDAVGRVGLRVVHHDVDAATARRGGAGEVDPQAVARYLAAARQRERLAVAVRGDRVLVHARPEAADGRRAWQPR